MASVKLPQATFSEAPRTTRRDPQTDAILRVMGANPVAGAINEVAPDVTDALTRRAKMKKEAQEVAQLASLTGEDPAFYNKLSLPTAKELVLKKLSHQYDLEKQRATAKDEYVTEDQFKSLLGDNPFAQPSVWGPMGMPKSSLSLYTTLQNRAALDRDRDSNRALREELGRGNLNLREEDQYRAMILDIEQKDPVIKELRRQDIGLHQTEVLLSKIAEGNSIAANAIGAKMARGMGEVGVMTDTDVVRYVESGMLTRKAADKLSKMLRGVPTDATLDEIRQITSALKDNYEKKVQPLYNKYIDSYASVKNMAPETFADKVKMRYTGGVKKAQGRWNPQTRKLEMVP